MPWQNVVHRIPKPTFLKKAFKLKKNPGSDKKGQSLQMCSVASSSIVQTVHPAQIPDTSLMSRCVFPDPSMSKPLVP